MNEKTITLILLNFMIISLTALFSLNRLDLFWKQYFFWFFGFLLFFLISSFETRFIFERYFYYSILFFSFLILILVLFMPGKIKSWFNLFGFYFQPSEFTKLAFFLLLTKFLTYYQKDLNKIVYLIFSIFPLLPFAILIFLQPDFGMVLLYSLIWFLSILPFLTRKVIFYVFLMIILIFIFFWFFILKDYQKQRILTFINPEIDPLKSGYNLRQIKLSLGTSSFLGKGVGMGEIGRLGFLPSAHTDFILTFLIEERGLLMFIVYSILLFIIVFEINKGQRFHKNPPIKNFLFIVGQYFIGKYTLTTLVNFGLFPIVGLPVPFLSYGGSHLIFDLIILGIVLSLSKERV
jgi:rod shape determining protein RodA